MMAGAAPGHASVAGSARTRDAALKENLKTVTPCSLALFVCCSAASAQGPAAPPKPSGDVPVCQSGRETALVDGRLHIRPGETLCIRLHPQGDAMAIDAVVSGPVTPGVLTLQASRDGTGTMLVLKNSLALPLKYRAWLRRPMRTTYEYTSSCPIEARLAAYESWRYGVDELVLSDFKVPTDSDGRVCK